MTLSYPPLSDEWVFASSSIVASFVPKFQKLHFSCYSIKLRRTKKNIRSYEEPVEHSSASEQVHFSLKYLDFSRTAKIPTLFRVLRNFQIMSASKDRKEKERINGVKKTEKSEGERA